MKDFQAHQAPKELVAHKVLGVSLEFLEALDHRGLALEEPPDGLG